MATNVRKLDNQNAEILGGWVVEQCRPLISPGMQASMPNVNGKDLTRIGEQIYHVCEAYFTNGNFPQTVRASNYGSSTGTNTQTQPGGGGGNYPNP